MDQKKRFQIQIGLSIIVNLLIASFGGIILLILKQSTKFTMPDLKAVTQITEDWEKIPFVDISVEK